MLATSNNALVTSSFLFLIVMVSTLMSRTPLTPLIQGKLQQLDAQKLQQLEELQRLGEDSVSVACEPTEKTRVNMYCDSHIKQEL